MAMVSSLWSKSFHSECQRLRPNLNSAKLAWDQCTDLVIEVVPGLQSQSSRWASHEDLTHFVKKASPCRLIIGRLGKIDLFASLINFLKLARV